MHEVLEKLLTSWAFVAEKTDGLAALAEVVVATEADPKAAESVRRALVFLQDDARDLALEALLYAQRQAPSSSLITLLIGDLRLQLRRAEAGEPYDLLARRSDWNAAWYRLAVTRLRAGLPDLAAVEMHGCLSRNAPLPGPEAALLMQDITRAGGERGWCGLSNDGVLIIGAAARTMPKITVTLDGEALPIGRRRVERQSGLLALSLGPSALIGHCLEVELGGVPLIGSPINPQSVARVEGFVDHTEDGVAGWCWLPGEPHRRPRIVVEDGSTQIASSADGLLASPANLQALRWQRRFAIDFAVLPEAPVAVIGPHGRPLYGSPLLPGGDVRSGMALARRLSARFPALGAATDGQAEAAADISIAARHRGRRSAAPMQAARRRTLIAIPVYRGLRATLDCLQSVLRHRGPEEDILVISDASPDAALVAELQRLAQRGAMDLRLEAVNRGFPGTANLALRQAAAAGQDIILLNSDTLVTAGWVARLREAAYGSADIGTATPFSNCATILSYPSPTDANALPEPAQIDALAATFAAENGGTIVDIPTGHGFCLFIRHDCLVETGVLREDVFAQGYGEENDFCLRARHLGWRHVAATGAYVGHLEGQSFATAKESLVARNLRRLNALHPGYDSLIREWEHDDPLRLHRRRVDMARLASLQGDRPVLCLVTHDRDGGVRRHVDTRAARAEAEGFLPLILKPGRGRSGGPACLLHVPGEAFPNLVFSVETELDLLQAFLRGRRIDHIELHHFIGHAPKLIEMVTGLVPYDLFLHDYAWFCPRITLTADGHRYCGEPELRVCEDCVRDRGSALGRAVEPAALITWSKAILTSARTIVAPTADTAARYARRFDRLPRVEPWEEEPARLHIKHVGTAAPDGTRRVCVVGAIGYEKGYQVLLDCARYAAANAAPVLFQVVGFTCDDARLLDTGKVTITGRYEEHEAVPLIRRQAADLAFLPALWPETWSYVLSQLWEAELPVVAFDIGAQAERIRRRSGGLLLPLSLPPSRIVRSLCNVISAPA